MSEEVQVATHWDSPLCPFDAPLEYYFCVVCPRNVFREQKMVMEVQVATSAKATSPSMPPSIQILCTYQQVSSFCKLPKLPKLPNLPITGYPSWI